MSAKLTIDNRMQKCQDELTWRSECDLIYLMPVDEDSLYELIGQRLKQKRARAGLTQSDLGIKVNLSRTSIANIEAGQQNAPLHVIYDICMNLQIQPQELLPSLDEMYSSPIEVADAIANNMVSAGSDKAAQTLRNLVRHKLMVNFDAGTI